MHLAYSNASLIFAALNEHSSSITLIRCTTPR